MFEEKRSNLRRRQDFQVHIDLIKASNESIDSKIRYEGSMWDFSSNGIRLHGKHAIEKGACLDIQIRFENEETEFNLSGNVKWVTKTTEDEYIAGLELDKSRSQDIGKWCEKFD